MPLKITRIVEFFITIFTSKFRFFATFEFYMRFYTRTVTINPSAVIRTGKYIIGVHAIKVSVIVSLVRIEWGVTRTEVMIRFMITPFKTIDPISSDLGIETRIYKKKLDILVIQG